MEQSSPNGTSDLQTKVNSTDIFEFGLLRNFSRAKDLYIRPPCTLRATSVHTFRAHQGRIYIYIYICLWLLKKKLHGTQRVKRSSFIILET